MNIYEKMISISFSSLMDIGAFEKVLAVFKNVSTEVKSGKISLKEKVNLK